MSFPRVLASAQNHIREHLKPKDIAVDGTCGNGSDTVFLAKLVGRYGKVYAFDVQEEAINSTKAKLIDNNLLDRVIFIQDGHEKITKWVKEPVNGAMFNLGYLPGSDKQITTRANTTIKAIESLFQKLVVNGIITIVVYTGHDEGNEAKKLEEYLKTIPQKYFSIIKYEFLNQKHFPPYLIAIKKIREISS